MTHVNWTQALNSRIQGCVPRQYAALVRAHGSSRAKALAYLLSIGGYYNHGQRWALSWNVKLHGSMDFDDLYVVDGIDARPSFTALCKNDGERGLLYHYMKLVYTQHENEWFGWATEDAWMKFQEDSHTFWGADRDSEFNLTGRSAGHLVMSRCGRINTSQALPDLMYELSERDMPDRGRYVVSNDDVAHLFLVAVQTSIDCSSKAVNSDVLHAAAYALWERAKEAEFKELQDIYRYQRRRTLEAALDGDTNRANDVRAMLGLPPERSE